MACSETSTKMEDLISNAPDIVIDKILENLSISMAAQTSVLSKQWRHTWLSLKSLIFGLDFWWEDNDDLDAGTDWQKRSRIISSILLHHKGPVHDFFLCIPYDVYRDCLNHGQWISFLSKNGVRKIVIRKMYSTMNISSYIYWCSELVHLELNGVCLKAPPTEFSGFPNLKHLELVNTEFTKQNIFCNLIESCKMLATLKLENWRGMVHIEINAPRLQTLILDGNFESLAFRNILSLKNILLYLREMPRKLATVGTIAALNLLASSCQLQTIQFDGYLCQFLAAGGIIRSPPDTFNHLDKLCLSDLILLDFDVFRYLLVMIECCPNIKKLDISVASGPNVECQHILDYNYTYKLDNLLEVNIKGIKGTIAELKLVEYLLAISPVLENLFFKFGVLSIEAKLQVAAVLMRFPRASTKASLVCLEKYVSTGSWLSPLNYKPGC
ncbi:hypothetical protein KSS87_013809 [Heliosperma pusillum]|nr:hypothetical protein KSS87_013809 [Heliosperma pusillum]